ncbi:hypothetical protein BC629DRAFT_1292440 [Irpex lacteus]|nr:hypothetical protein BC629DRAFT_1292440 [Irpex lacteus]
MTIAEGEYYIHSAAGDFQVGRLHREDRSLLPKRVVSLPPGDKPDRPWIVIKDGDKNLFTLKANGAPTAAIDHKLFAILLDTPEPTKWKLIRAERHGEDAYIVTTEDGRAGWVLPSSEPYDQIAVRPLIVGPSNPPTYPLNQVFIFKSVKEN